MFIAKLSVHYNALNRAITIFLLVCQQLERIDLVQRRSVRFEDLHFSGIDTKMHYQYSVGCSPFVLDSTSCTPPAAMFLLSVVAVSVLRGYHQMSSSKKSVAMWTNVRQRDSSQPIN